MEKGGYVRESSPIIVCLRWCDSLAAAKLKGVQKLTCWASARRNGQLLDAFASVIGHWERFYCNAHVIWGEYDMRGKYLVEKYG